MGVDRLGELYGLVPVTMKPHTRLRNIRLCLLALLFFPAAVRAERDRYIVMFRPGSGPAANRAALRSAGARPVRELRLINSAVVELPQGAAAARAALSAEPAVAGVYEDAAAFSPGSVPLSLERSYAAAEGYIGAGGGYDDDFPWYDPPAPPQFVPWGVESTGARAAGNGGEGVRVCVVDSGVDPLHKDLRDNIAGGINTTGDGPERDYGDYFGHGSHVAGSIAALDNSYGVVGVAPHVSLYAARVIRKAGTGRFSDVLSGIEWCVEEKTRIINLSLTVPYDYPPLKEAVAAVDEAGVLIVAAAGNSGGAVEFPAAYPQVIAVAAMDRHGKAADFSPRGPEIDFIAPGVDIDSTYLRGMYSANSGTSMAAPHVAGLAAIAISARGLLTPAEVRRALANAASPLSSVPAAAQGSGAIDAGRLTAK